MARNILEKTRDVIMSEVENTWNYIAKVYAVDADDDSDVEKEVENLKTRGCYAMADDLLTDVHEYKAMKNQLATI